MRPRRAAGGRGRALLPLLGVLFVRGVQIVLSLEIHVDAHVRGYVGEKIKLKCTFKSTSDVTDKLTIDWTYRPPSSSRTEFDNGTFSCAVKNPPDVYHNIPLTELTVTERAVVVVLLLVRMGRKAAGMKKRSKSGYKKSSIEVSDDTDQEEKDDCMARLCVRCAECLDSDYEDTY
uniref:myelin protein zero-like protein 3 isoform X5 n=1 Tax=Jaculus jaculus TaxID=51337 RepID=UPI001E1B0578|nr:myelin protein zero-like protein 3 isoform X5 [Jaculus jaculus]